MANFSNFQPNPNLKMDLAENLKNEPNHKGDIFDFFYSKYQNVDIFPL